MEAFAEAAARDSAMNPRLVNLRGAVHLHEGELLSLQDDEAAALQQYNLAIAISPEREFLLARGELYLEVKDYTRALGDLRGTLLLRPQGVDALKAHARTLYHIAERSRPGGRMQVLEMVIEEMTLLRAIVPNDEEVTKLLTWVLQVKQSCGVPSPQC